MEKDSRINALHQGALKYARLDFAEKISTANRGDEIDTIAAALNTLADALQNSEAHRRQLINELLHVRHHATALEDERSLYTSIVNLSDDAIISKNLDGIITSWNSGAEKIFGYTAGEIIGKHISILIPKNLQQEETEIMQRIKNGQLVDHYETDRLTKNGSIIHVSLTISPVKDAQGKITGASKISRNITLQKKAESELLKSNRLYAFLSAINKSIVHINHPETLLLNACKIATEIGKFESARVGLLDDSGRLNMLNPLPNPTAGNDLQRYSGTDFSSHLLRDTPTGKVLATGAYAFSNDAQNDPDLSPWHNEMINTGINSCASFPFKKFGRTVGVFSFLSSQKNFFDEKELNLLNESAADISFALEIFEKEKMRKSAQSEVILLNATLEAKISERTEQLEYANKELESFSYSVAHDLRSPLRAIHGYSNILSEDCSAMLDDEGRRLLKEIEYNAKKMGLLIDELLTFSKIGRKEMHRDQVNMNLLFAETLNDLEKAQKHHAKITVALLHPIIADAGLLKHVTSNLLSNAIKYSSKTALPVIEVQSVAEKENIIYSVTDNGVGFNMQFAAKLFGVFQRLHSEEEFEGTGVGLAIAQRIINRHGGKIWAQSEENKGATFYFSLPALLQKTE